MVLHIPPADGEVGAISTDRRGAFAQAYDKYQHGELPAAVAIFQTLEKEYPELVDYHLFFAGAGLRQLGDLEGAQAALKQLRREYPQSTKAPAAALELGMALAQDGRGQEARPYLQIAQGSDDTAIRVAARMQLADLDERSGDYQTAYSSFLEIRRDNLGNPFGNQAKKRVQALRAQYPVLDPVGRGIIDEARLLLRERDFRGAKTPLEQLLLAPARIRGGVDEAEILRMLADAFYGVGDVDRAVALLRNLAERYPGTAIGAEAMYRRGTIFWNRDRDDEALGVFESFLERYPRHDRAAEALYAIGRIHQQAGRGDGAIEAYTRLSRLYPGSSVAADARWRIGWVHYRNQRFDAAAGAFANLTKEGNDSARDGALYWQARSLGQSGKAGTATELYQRVVRRDPASYYSMWAERRLRGSAAGSRSGSPSKAMLDTTLPTTPQISLPPAPTVADTFHLDRALELHRTGVFDLARAELAALAEAYPDDREVSAFVFQAYPSVDGYSDVLRRLRKSKSTTGTRSADERERLLYPLAFWGLVQPRSQTYAVDPLLIESLMRQESLFDPRAYSPANARGLMQLLPSTAQRVAGNDDTAAGEIDLYNPETNVELGTRYLRSLLTRFNSDPLKAIAAYNGGESAVEKWQKRYGDLEPDEFVESITFRETRDYVKKVVANYRKYSTLYPRTS